MTSTPTLFDREARSAHVVEVAVLAPLEHALTYLAPQGQGALAPGARVLCELGRRRVLGVVLRGDLREIEPGERARLKPLDAVVDAEAILPAELLGFLVELAAYYLAPPGEVLRLALPAIERERVRTLRARGELDGVALREVGGRSLQVVRPTSSVEPAGTLRGQAAQILALLRATGEQAVARLEERFGNARAAVRKLASLGLVTVGAREAPRDPYFADAPPRDLPPELNPAQELAAERIAGDVRARRPQGYLLFGVTGSGKTEVYLRAIAACLETGRGALVLVPEIALTPQLVARFRARFGDDVAVLHSGLQDADRHAMWAALRSGRLRVAVGARSALFAPVPDLGLLVVDEEHDGSFKQEEGVRYHARDMALLRAHRAGATVVLGSATPSLEAWALVRRGKLALLRLPDRAHATAALPVVEVVDLRRIGPGPAGLRLLSLPLHRAIERTLEAGEQAILFLNRRGFAPTVVCDACGAVETCRACSVALTLHRQGGGELRCHYCGYVDGERARCSACGAAELLVEGLGTERLEQALGEAFPNARVGRLDRDVASGARSARVLDRMRARELDLLVGTQMVTKGHDLPAVTLVGVIHADASLSLPDFRAAERGFQLLVQVAGRAGRAERPGHVVVQTRNPGHPAILHAVRHDVEGFCERELADRGELGYPPFARLALVRVDAVAEALARETAARLARLARDAPDVAARKVDVLGPAPAPIARLRGRYRYRVLLRSSDRGGLRRVLLALAAARRGLDRRCRIVLDVDPVAMM